MELAICRIFSGQSKEGKKSSAIRKRERVPEMLKFGDSKILELSPRTPRRVLFDLFAWRT